jgi:ABC-type polysaccharide/polyol phosphate export permease
MLKELWSRRELILSLVRRDLKTRYKSSVLGFLWSFCKPLLLMLVLFVVFSVLVRLESEGTGASFALFLLSGILAWTYLAGSINEALFSIISNTSLVRKTYIPPQVFPVVTILSNLFHFLLALVVYFIILFLYKVIHGNPPGSYVDWRVLLLPLVIALHTFFIFGLALLLAALNVFYRDIASIMEVFVMAWFYLSPILYPVGVPMHKILAPDVLPDWLFPLYMLNPMAPILEAYRETLLLPSYSSQIGPSMLLVYLALAFINSLILFIIGRAAFRHYSGRFADEV